MKKNKIMSFQSYLKENKMEAYSIDMTLTNLLMMIESIVGSDGIDCENGKNLLIDAQTKIEEAKQAFAQCTTNEVVKTEEPTDEVVDDVENEAVNEPIPGTTELQSAKDLEDDEKISMFYATWGSGINWLRQIFKEIENRNHILVDFEDEKKNEKIDKIISEK